jgi:hypothetical protein
MSIIRTLSIVLFFLTVWTTGLQAQYPYPDRPLHVRITGALLPLDQEKREDIITVNVFIKDQPRLLRIGKIEQITQQQKDHAVEQDVLLKQIRFYGSDELIDTLSSQEIIGKPITIEGRLDTQERRFLVSSVEEVSPRDTASPADPSPTVNP